jgi:hypothetical protein
LTTPKLFIVIDGLDECEQAERKLLLDTFMDIVTQCEQDDPGKLRILVVSQDYSDIKRSLEKHVLKTVALSASDNESDIETYVRGWVHRIAVRFPPFSEDMADYLRSRTVASAKGMWLFLGLLYYQLTLARACFYMPN